MTHTHPISPPAGGIDKPFLRCLFPMLGLLVLLGATNCTQSVSTSPENAESSGESAGTERTANEIGEPQRGPEDASAGDVHGQEGRSDGAPIEGVTSDGPPETQATVVTFRHTLSKSSLYADGQDTTTIKTTIIDPVLPDVLLADLKLQVTTTAGTFINPQTNKPLELDPKTNTGTLPYDVAERGFVVILQADQQGGQTATVTFSLKTARYVGTSERKIDIIAPGFLEFVSAAPAILSAGSGSAAPSLVRFRVLDINRLTFGGKLTVHFTLSATTGGISLSKQNAVTDENGAVDVHLRPGTVAASVTITARVSLPTPQSAPCHLKCTQDSDCDTCGYSCFNKQCARVLEATSKPIAIVGGRPNHKNMSFSCDARNIGALYGMVGNNVTANIDTKCTVTLGDRFSNKIGFATQVLFAIEAGSIDSTAQTIPFSTTGSTQNIGKAFVLSRTQNPPPTDVLPMSVPNVKNCGNAACSIPDPALGLYDPQKTQNKEPFAYTPYDCTTSFLHPRLQLEPFYQDANGRVRNPRDGLVTVLAYTNGEEAYTDTNKNGKYDPGEPFVDLGEPYLDVNDNNQHDIALPGNSRGERFIDLPCTRAQVTNGTNGCTKVGVGNGRHDGPNGRWDSNTLIWKKTWILWTGRATLLGPQANIEPVVHLSNCQTTQFHSGISPRGKFSVEPGKNAVYDTTIHDLNLNPLTPLSSVKYTAAQLQLQQAPPSNGAGLADLGFTVLTGRSSLPSGAQRIDDFIVHSTFFGLSAISHRLTLIDQDGTKAATAIPTKLDVVITSKAKDVPTTYTDSFFIQGETY